MQHSAYKCYRQHSAYNNMVLCTKTFVKRAILMLRILTTKKEKKKKREKEHKETFGSDGYVYCLHCCDSIMVHAYVQAHQIVYFKCIGFFCISNIPQNKMFFKKR